VHRNRPALFKDGILKPRSLPCVSAGISGLGLASETLKIIAERNLTVDHVHNLAMGAAVRAGTAPALPPGTAQDKSVVARG